MLSDVSDVYYTGTAGECLIRCLQSNYCVAFSVSTQMTYMNAAKLVCSISSSPGWTLEENTGADIYVRGKYNFARLILLT